MKCPDVPEWHTEGGVFTEVKQPVNNLDLLAIVQLGKKESLLTIGKAKGWRLKPKNLPLEVC